MNKQQNPNSDGMAAQEDEMTLKDMITLIKNWVNYLFSKWLIILIAGIAGGALGIGYSLYKKPLYTAATTFVLEEGGSSGALGDYAGLASMVGINIGGSSNGLFAGDNIIELYKSRVMVQKTLLSTAEFNGKKQSLINRYIESNELRERWDKNPRLKDISFDDSTKFTLQHDSILRIIVKDITEKYLNVEKPDKKLSIISVQVTSKDEQFAKCYTENLVSAVNKFYVDTKTQKTKDNVAILQHQTDSVRAVMNGAIYQSVSTIDATPNLNPARQILRAPVQRSQFTAEANKVILGELIKNLELSKITLRKETPLIQVIDVPILPLEMKRVGKAKGLIIGGLLAGFITVMILIIRKLYKNFVLNG